MIVENRAPMWHIAIRAIRNAAHQGVHVRDHLVRAQIVDRVQQGMVVGQVDDFPVGKDAFHAAHERLYTYSLRDQDVVLVNAGVSVIGRLPTAPVARNKFEDDNKPVLKDW